MVGIGRKDIFYKVVGGGGFVKTFYWGGLEKDIFRCFCEILFGCLEGNMVEFLVIRG